MLELLMGLYDEGALVFPRMEHWKLNIGNFVGS